MPFAFQTIEPETGIPVTERDLSLVDYWQTKIARGTQYTMGGAFGSWISDLFDDSPLLDAKTANMQYPLPDGREHTEPVREDRARRMQERADVLALINAKLDGYKDVGLIRWATGFAAETVGGVSNPVDFSFNLIPFVGSSTKAAMLAKMGAGRFSTMAARGLLVSEEAIAQTISHPRLAAAVIDATAGNILAEIPVAIEARRNKEDYGAGDFAANIAGGALFAAGIHGLSRALSGAREIHSRLSEQTQTDMTRQAVSQTMRGLPVDVHERAAIDPKVMEAEWKAREGGIIAEAEAIIRSEQTRSMSELSEIAANREARGLPLDETQTKAALEDPGFAARVNEIKAISSKTIDERLANVPEYVRDEIKRQHDLAKTIGKLDEIVNASFSGRTASEVAADVLPGYPLSDAKDMIRSVRAAEGIPSMDDIRSNAADSPSYQAFVQDRINQYVEAKKKEFNETYQREQAIVKAKEDAQSAGPLAKPDDLARLESSGIPEAALADIKAEASELKAEIEAGAKELAEADPELAAHIKEMADAELKKIDDPEPRAVEAALNCLINE